MLPSQLGQSLCPMLLPGMRGNVDFKKWEVSDILKQSNKIIHYSFVLCVWEAKQALRGTEQGALSLGWAWERHFRENLL